MLVSAYRPLNSVSLPWKNRQKYMLPINLRKIDMQEYSDYQEAVESLCKSSNAIEGTAYVTIDEKIIPAGMSQRRPKPHVDGCFIPELLHWGHNPGWNHFCNHLPIPRMAVIVASTVSGCKAWKGEFKAIPKNNGDLSHIEDSLGEGEILPANKGFLLSPDCIHESMVFNEETKRTFLRIALPTQFNYFN